MDKITIKGLEIFANHGVYDFEKKNGQKFYVDLDFYLDASIIVDDIEKTVHYGLVAKEIKRFLTENNYDLIEILASDLAKDLLLKFDKIDHLSLTINKPNAPIDIPFTDVSATVNRGWHTAYIAMGSNLGNKQQYILNAIDNLKNDANCKVLKVSSLIETEPYGVVDQPDFINGCMKISTIYTPFELLQYLQSLEKLANRVKLRHWGERTLDLDILMYDNEVIFSDTLKIPHPEMHIRDFVLTPLVEIEPYLVHPIKNKSVNELLNDLKHIKNY